MERLFLLSLIVVFSACKNNSNRSIENISPSVPEKTETNVGDEVKIEIDPIRHASFMLSFAGKTIYVDPVGGTENYQNRPMADLVLVTDIHQDHFDQFVLENLVGNETLLIVPLAVAKQLPISLKEKATIMHNGDTLNAKGIEIQAIPMYNLREEAKQFHPKGRGNGYVLQYKDKRIYIAGDTGDIPEMRNLKNIDIAFIPMNLPWTMPVSRAADAVLDFKPKKVYPYHYKGTKGFSDVDKFRNIIETNSDDIEVVQLDWYPDE